MAFELRMQGRMVGTLFTLRNGTYANMTTSRDRFWIVHPPLNRHVHVMVRG
jgi:hypothetical protein